MKQITYISILLLVLLTGFVNAASKYGNGALGVCLGQTIAEVTSILKGGTSVKNHDGRIAYTVLNKPGESIAQTTFLFNESGKLFAIVRELSQTYIQQNYAGNYKRAYYDYVEKYDTKYGKHEFEDTSEKSIIVTQWPNDERVLISLRFSLDSGSIQYYMCASVDSGL